MFTCLCKIGIDTTLFNCDDCGAVVAVGYQRLHAEFHARIAELEAQHASA